MLNSCATTLTKNQLINLTLIDNQSQLVKFHDDIIDMLTMWGRYHHYRTHCGYRRMSAFVAVNNPQKTPCYIQDDIDIIDEILLELKDSPKSKQQQEYAVIEAYYKGIDLVVDGYDWSQKLTIRDIADYLKLPKSTVSNRKKSAELFILQQINNKVNLS